METRRVGSPRIQNTVIASAIPLLSPSRGHLSSCEVSRGQGPPCPTCVSPVQDLRCSPRCTGLEQAAVRLRGNCPSVREKTVEVTAWWLCASQVKRSREETPTLRTVLHARQLFYFLIFLLAGEVNPGAGCGPAVA